MNSEKNRVDRTLDWLRNHWFFSVVILLGIFLLTVSGVIKSVGDLYDLFQRARKPHLELSFITSDKLTKNLEINPHWQDETGSGFSDPIPIKIALRNTGEVKATNVQVRMIYRASGVALSGSSGDFVPPPVIPADVFKIYGGEAVTLYRINEIDPSPVFDLLEKDLQLRLQLRTVTGWPVMEDGIVKILLSHIDFFYSDAKEWGKFPIYYVLTYSESNKPLSGMLLLTIDSATLKSYEQKKQEVRHIKMDFIAEVDVPQFEEPRDITVKKLTLFTKGVDSLKNLIIKGGIISNIDIVEGEIKENISEKSVWHEIFINGRKVYIEADTNKDNYVDSVYYRIRDSEKDRWFHLKPVMKYNFIPLDHILDIMKIDEFVKKVFIEAGHRP
jgi:hypothetical protein